jgi:hypothetical protein
MKCINREPGAVAMGGYHSIQSGPLAAKLSGNGPSLRVPY